MQALEVKKSVSYLNILLVSLIGIGACTKKNDAYTPTFSDMPSIKVSSKPVYVVSTHPLSNQQRVFEMYQPLIDSMNQKIPEAEFKLETALDYPDYEKKLYQGNRYHFSIPNPLQTLEAVRKGHYKIIGKVADDSIFRGIILVKTDSKIKTMSDLKGKTIAYPAATALAACLMPQMFFSKNGIDVNQEIKNIFVGSQESAITAVALDQADVGVTWPPPWKGFQKNFPEIAKKVKVIWETPSLVNNSLVAQNDVPQEIVKQVAKVFFELKDSESGRKLLDSLNYSGFEPATNKTYEPVLIFLKDFSKNVRPIEGYP